MRGSPLLRAGLVFVALLVLLIPLRSLTRAREAVAPATPAPTATQLVTLEITATDRPARFTVTHLGQPIWSGEVTDGPVATELSLPFPKEGVDLGLSARWPGAKTGAVKLTVTPDGADPVDRTAWGEGAVDDVFTFR